MRVKLQLVICNDEGHEETVTDVITLNKNNQRIEHLGLTLLEAKQLLSTTQRHLLRQQVDAFLDTCSDCPDCGTPLKLKARASRSFRTLFGTFNPTTTATLDRVIFLAYAASKGAAHHYQEAEDVTGLS